MSKETKVIEQEIKPYKHDVYTCIKKIIKNEKRNDILIDSIQFELANISKPFASVKRHKTGQRAKIFYAGKRKPVSTFFTHNYCPFCGKKF